MDPSRIHDEFPAPEFRPTQKQALADICTAFEAGNEVVLVRAPTGSGKSLLARAVAGSAARGSEASATDPIGAYYTTPQVSQLDDVAADPLLEDLDDAGPTLVGSGLPVTADSPSCAGRSNSHPRQSLAGTDWRSSGVTSAGS